MKKILFGIVVVAVVFLFNSGVKADTVDEYLSYESSSTKYTITILKDVGSTMFNNFFISKFGDMLDKDIEIVGNNKKITYDGATTGSFMITIGSTNFTKGAPATFNETTKVWEGTPSNYGWYGYDNKLKFSNIKFIGSSETTSLMIMYIVLPYADVDFESCEFELYQKAAIWSANFNSMTINNSIFDGNGVDPDETDTSLYKQSSSNISLCLGDEFIPGTSSYSAHKIESIKITNNTFKNVVKETPNGTGAIKFKIKNKTVVTGVDEILVKGNTFTDNEVDIIVGEKNPEVNRPTSRPTTADESADLNFIFNGNTSNNTNGLSIQTVHDTVANPTVISRTDYIANTITGDILFNALKDLELKMETGSTDLTINGDTNLVDALDYLQNDTRASSVTGLVIKGSNYSIKINKNDIKESRDSSITDLSLSFTSTIPDNLTDLVKTGSIYLSSTVSGELPVNKLTVSTKIADFANRKVRVSYYNETDEELETVGTVIADKDGNIDFDLEHYSNYVLEPLELVKNPATGDNISNILILSGLSIIGLFISSLYLKKSLN